MTFPGLSLEFGNDCLGLVISCLGLMCCIQSSLLGPMGLHRAVSRTYVDFLYTTSEVHL